MPGFAGLRRPRQARRSAARAGAVLCELGHRARGQDGVDQPGRLALADGDDPADELGARQVVGFGPATGAPSIRTAPASMSRRAALVLAARPAATSSRRQVHRIAVGQRRARARRLAPRRA